MHSNRNILPLVYSHLLIKNALYPTLKVFIVLTFQYCSEVQSLLRIKAFFIVNPCEMKKKVRCFQHIMTRVNIPFSERRNMKISKK